MKHRLFVRDFGKLADVSELEALFSNVGTVCSATLEERVSNGITRQVAFIEMSNSDEVRDCIDRLHGTKIAGHTLTVTEDKPHIPDPNFRAKRAALLEEKKRAVYRPKDKKKPVPKVQA